MLQDALENTELSILELAPFIALKSASQALLLIVADLIFSSFHADKFLDRRSESVIPESTSLANQVTGLVDHVRVIRRIDHVSALEMKEKTIILTE